MQERRLSARAIILGSALLLGLPFASHDAGAASQQTSKATQASTQKNQASKNSPTVNALRGKPATQATSGTKAGLRTSSAYAAFPTQNGVRVGKGKAYARGLAVKNARQSYAYRGGISCVPYVRAATGMDVSGNAWQWWENAAGSYARGYVPEPGSVLAFRSNGRMPMGHVAVVTHVVNPRQVIIDHANWPTSGGRGAVARNVAVVDVSDRNDWSAVRVELGRSGDFGSVYPTHGFIYDRPDTGAVRLATRAPAPQLALNPAHRDLRSPADRAYSRPVEVAEAPATPPRRQSVYLPELTNNWSTQVFNGGN